jgi:hypothetical protein
MRWHVVWKPRALTDLANIWLESSSPQAVRQASDWIDKVLRRDPFGKGESRSGQVRIYVRGPLTVYARIIEDDRRVDVLIVHRNRRGHSGE